MAFSDFVGMLLRGAYLSFHRHAQAKFMKLGVTADQYVLLSVLAEDCNLTQKELGKRTYSDANTITAMLNLLAGKGLVERTVCPLDGRARRVGLTKQGRSLHRKLQRIARAFHRDLERTLPTESRAQIHQWLRRVIADLGSAAPVVSKGRNVLPAQSKKQR